MGTLCFFMCKTISHWFMQNTQLHSELWLIHTVSRSLRLYYEYVLYKKKKLTIHTHTHTHIMCSIYNYCFFIFILFRLYVCYSFAYAKLYRACICNVVVHSSHSLCLCLSFSSIVLCDLLLLFARSFSIGIISRSGERPPCVYGLHSVSLRLWYIVHRPRQRICYKFSISYRAKNSQSQNIERSKENSTLKRSHAFIEQQLCPFHFVACLQFFDCDLDFVLNFWRGKILLYTSSSGIE